MLCQCNKKIIPRQLKRFPGHQIWDFFRILIFHLQIYICNICASQAICVKAYKFHEIDLYHWKSHFNFFFTVSVQCPKGLTGDTCKEDIDECSEYPNICNNDKCMNKPGTYECVTPMPAKERWRNNATPDQIKLVESSRENGRISFTMI